MISYTCMEMDYSPHFYILLALAVISTSEFSVQGFQLPLPNDIDGEDLGEVVVNVKENGARYRRSADGVSVPAKNMDIIFTLNESNIDLHLQRRDEITSNVPIFTMDGEGSVIKEFIQNKNNIFFYQDVERFAAFYVETSEDSSCFFGTFEDQNNEFFLEPKDLDCKPGTGQSLFKVLKVKHRNFTYSDYIQSKTRSMDLSPDSDSHSDEKRSVPEYKIEMLLITDYAIYNYWYSQSKASTTAEKDMDAKFNIRQYYAWVINGMDVRYKNIQTAAYKISIVYAGIYIADTAAKSGFTEYFKDSSSPRPGVDSSAALTNGTNWIQSTSGLPAHDHAMMFTRYDLTSDGSSSNKGLAYLSVVCKPNSASIVEDDFDFVILTVAAHELGHSLGAMHDEYDNKCFKSDAYIMAPSAGVPVNTNPWKFSPCSTNEFTTYINSLNKEGRNCMTSLSPTFDPTALNQFTNLPGQVYDVDGLCKQIHGNGSSFCRFPYKGDYSSLCLSVYCWKTDGSGKCVGSSGVDGLQCGNKKLCSSGVCTYDVCAPHADESCLFGDDPSFVLKYVSGASKTCADVPSSPSMCYNEDAKSACCKTCSRFYTGRPGCEYGDKTTGCSQAYCPQYKDTLCCGYCYTGAAISTVPSPTEGPNLCKITTYKQNTPSSTIKTMQSTRETITKMQSSTTARDKTTSSTSNRSKTQPSTTILDVLSSTSSAVTTTTSVMTNLKEVVFSFIIQMDITITEDLSNRAQYHAVKEKSEIALINIYKIKLGDSFKSCNVTGLKKGSLIVDYDVYTKSVSSATANIVSANQDLVSGKANVTYDGKAAPVSSMAFKDKSGKTVNFTSTTTQCEVLEASNPCTIGSQCVEEQTGPVCRAVPTEKGFDGLLIVIIIVSIVLIIVIVVAVALYILCRRKPTPKKFKNEDPKY
uniref:A disintegrin and metalloproteinase with thrombospondin motifs 6-like isoform X7 n=1 Tax=Crassostrea virginica TaxID=6565 RepID=A0A8B8D9R4_CRAVI|nr:A disintegrin and metalloproteinase with thrombospondin motifs 6-like isoform X7 [Crassostrea virginica]